MISSEMFVVVDLKNPDRNPPLLLFSSFCLSSLSYLEMGWWQELGRPGTMFFRISRSL